MTALHIAAARAGELDVAFALLPHAAGQGVAAESVLVARRSGAIAGVAAFSSTPWESLRSGLRGAIFVLPSQRRRGVASALLAALGAAVRRWDVDYLHAWGEWDAAGAPPFLARSGFEPQRKMFYFEADTRHSGEQCDQVLRRLRAGGRIPPGAAVTTLAPHHLPQAIALYGRHVQLAHNAAAAHFDATLADPACAALTQVLELDGRLIGLLLWKRDPVAPAVDLWVTQPGFRHGWPALLLLEAANRQLMRLGLPRYRFACNDATRTTLQIARRVEATLLRTAQTYVLAF
jgi:GNAT superfamily N-acetyltransferase